MEPTAGVTGKGGMGRGGRWAAGHLRIVCDQERRRRLGISSQPVSRDYRRSKLGEVGRQVNRKETRRRAGRVRRWSGNGSRHVHPTPPDNIVWRSGRTSLLIGEKESVLI